jgi:hypothetical protein
LAFGVNQDIKVRKQKFHQSHKHFNYALWKTRGNGEKILIANISGTIKKQFAALDFMSFARAREIYNHEKMINLALTFVPAVNN